MSPIVIELSGEPVGQGRPRFVRATGRAYTPAHTAKAQAALRVAASDAMGARTPIDGPVAMVVIATLPVPTSWSGKKTRLALAGAILPISRPDLDNYEKLVCDALNLVVFRDDSQIVDLHASKRYGEKPSLRIEVTPIILPAVEALSRVRPGDGMAQLPLEGAAP